MACGSLAMIPYTSISARGVLLPVDSLTSVPFRSRVSCCASRSNGELAKFLDNNSISDFMRYRNRNGDGDRELQTAVVRYKKRFPWSLIKPFLQVDLVSTIHIADKEYFKLLQKDLEQYDCVLYEMVTSRECLENRKNKTSVKKLTSSSRRSKGFNIIGFIQKQMARILSLDFQLDCLDYEDDKWCHADLDYETFKELQNEKGESFFTFAKDVTIRSTKAIVEQTIIPKDLTPWKSKLLQASRVFPMPLFGILIIGSVCFPLENGVTQNPEMEALFKLDIGAAMKIFLARRLTSEFAQITSAIEEESVIIGERNKVAMKELQRAIDDGNRSIAILYGGGHMPDLGRRLREEFNMVPSEVQWVTAWLIKNQERNYHSFPFLKRLARIMGWQLNRYQTLALIIFSSVLAIDLWLWELFFGSVVNWASYASSHINMLTGSIGSNGFI